MPEGSGKRGFARLTSLGRRDVSAFDTKYLYRKKDVNLISVRNIDLRMATLRGIPDRRG